MEDEREDIPWEGGSEGEVAIQAYEGDGEYGRGDEEVWDLGEGPVVEEAYVPVLRLDEAVSHRKSGGAPRS